VCSSDLLNREAWHEKADAFEAELAKIEDEGSRKATRATYAIRIDGHDFGTRQKEWIFSEYSFPVSVSFIGANFGEGNVSFIGANFDEGNVSFIEATFGEGNVSFRGATFGEGGVYFIRAKFSEDGVSFNRTKFGEGNVSFCRANFSVGEVSFNSATFGDGDVDFTEATSERGDVDFTAAAFGEGEVNFSRVKFGKGNVSFSGAEYGKGTVVFIGADFHEGDVDFSGTVFQKGDVDFSGAAFGDGNVSFARATFGDGIVSFTRVNFDRGNVDFSRAAFKKGDIDFSGAVFGKGNVSFRRANFGKGKVSFSGATFGEGNVYLLGVNMKMTSMSAPDMEVAGNLYVKSSFPQNVDFRRLRVDGTADFSGSEFAEIPDFRDAKLDRPPEVAGMKVPPPAMNGERFWHFKTCDDKDAVGKYRKLKAMAIAANDHEKDGEFFSYEMMAKRGIETTGFWGLLFNSVYWMLSDFGQSYLRPMVGLAISFLGFAATYFWIIGNGLTDMREKIGFVAELSARTFLPLVNSLFRFTPVPGNGHESSFQKTFHEIAHAGVNIELLTWLGVAQQFLGIILLFLLLLALRNKFRLK